MAEDDWRWPFAFHEAGHAVVAAALGYKPTHATIMNQRGLCHYAARTHTRDTLAAIRSEITADVAGYVGQCIGTDDDWQTLDLHQVLVLEHNPGFNASVGFACPGPDGYRSSAAAILRPDHHNDTAAAEAATRWLNDTLPRAAATAARLIDYQRERFATIAARLANAGVVHLDRAHELAQGRGVAARRNALTPLTSAFFSPRIGWLADGFDD
jgi:hypothetical protein